MISALLLAVLNGFLFVRAMLPGQKICRHDFLKLAFGAGFGLGLGSVLFYLGLLLAGSASFAALLPEICASLALVYFAYKRRRPCLFCRSKTEYGGNVFWLRTAVFAALAAGSATFVFSYLSKPHGGWDAWAIWNLRARFLLRAGTNWTDAFSPLLPHPDYPILLPSLVARCWTLAGEGTLVPVSIAAVFALSTVAALYVSIEPLCGERLALVALLLLLSAGNFATIGAHQCADIPLSFFILSCIALLVLQETRGAGTVALSSLAGVSAGLAAWTKNEGLAFVAVAAVAYGSVLLVYRPGREAVRQIASFLTGLSPALILVAYFKAALPANDIMSAAGSSMDRFFDVNRLGTIAGAFAAQVIVFDGVSIKQVFLSTILFVIVFVVHAGVRPRYKQAAILTALALAGMTITYFFVYLITPHNLTWHLGTSLSRLCFQLWPSFVFLIALVMRDSRDSMATS
jgi:hypothetical protein